jgi:hypothetical protein
LLLLSATPIEAVAGAIAFIALRHGQPDPKGPV